VDFHFWKLSITEPSIIVHFVGFAEAERQLEVLYEKFKETHL